MKDTSENYPPSRQSVRPETTTERRPQGSSYSSTRHSQTRPVTSKYSDDMSFLLYYFNVDVFDLVVK